MFCHRPQRDIAATGCGRIDRHRRELTPAPSPYLVLHSSQVAQRNMPLLPPSKMRISTSNRRNPSARGIASNVAALIRPVTSGSNIENAAWILRRCRADYLCFFWKKKIKRIDPVALQVPTKGEKVDPMRQEDVKRLK